MMKKFFMNKKGKDNNVNDYYDTVTQGLSDLRRRRRVLEKMSESLLPQIDKAGRDNNKKGVKLLIAQKVRVNKWIERLNFWDTNIIYLVNNMRIASEMEELAVGLKGLVELGNKNPAPKDGFSVLIELEECGRGVEKALDEAMNKIIAPDSQKTADAADEGILGFDNDSNDIENTPEFKVEYEAMIERISQSNSATVASPAFSKADNIDNTGDIDFSGLIDNLNNTDTDK